MAGPSVVPSFLKVAAGRHSDIADGLKYVTQSVSGISPTVPNINSSYTSKFNDVLAQFETVRNSTAQSLQAVSNGLATNLLSAANVYLSRDKGLAGVIDKVFG